MLKTKEELEQRKQAQKRSSEYSINMDLPPVLYGRQSTEKQTVVNKQAALMQTDDLFDLAEEHGWRAGVGWLFIENFYDKFGAYNATGRARDASGKLRIDVRPGLQHVLFLVETGQTSAVVFRDVSRLFRDDTLVGPTTFATACKEHHGVPITPAHLY